MVHHGVSTVGSEETAFYSTKHGEPKVGPDMVVQGPGTTNEIWAEGTVTSIQVDPA